MTDGVDGVGSGRAERLGPLVSVRSDVDRPVEPDRVVLHAQLSVTRDDKADALRAVAIAVDLPAVDEQVGFDQHIKALFRQRDRQSMKFAVDLWAYDDGSRHSGAILERLRAGTMPCDGAWPSGCCRSRRR